MRPSLPAVCLLVLGFVALPSVTLAQQWLFTPIIEMGAQHIDNPRLLETSDTDNITGGLLDVAAEMRRNTETAYVLFRPGAAIYRYSGDSDEDSEAFRADFDAEKRGQRSAWRFGANFRQQQVFHGETTPSAIDDIGGVDDSVQTGSGRTFERRERNLWTASPGFTFEFTEKTAIDVELNYLDVRYDTEDIGEAVDYTNARADAAIVRTLSPNSKFEFGVFAAKYEPDTAFRETDSTGVRARYENEVSNVSTFFIDIGAQDSNIQNATLPQGETSETSFLWNIGYDRRWERTRWYFDIGQNVTPSGSGAMVKRDLYRAIMQHQLQPRWSLQFAAVVMNTQTLGDENLIATNDRDYLQGQAALAWQMTRNWTVEGRYILTHQDFSDIPGDAQKHEVGLSLIYRPPVPTL